jgi:hypothetical protein
MQVDDIRGAKMVRRMGVADLADDHVVANAGLGQRLDVGESERLALLDANVGLRRLCAQCRLLLLVQGVSDQPSGDRPEGAANQRAFAGVSASDDGA